MTKYNTYARKLDTAFKTAREKYVEAYNALKAAKKKVEDAKYETDKRFKGEADYMREEYAHALRKAEIVFDNIQENVWPAFDEVRDELTKKLRAEVRADGIAVPEDLDANAMTLLQSGILRIDELEILAERFSGNYTMLRIIGQHAKAAADKAENAEERARLVNISHVADGDRDNVLQMWDKLLEAARVGSGRSRGEERGDPILTVSVSKAWERMTEGIVESF